MPYIISSKRTDDLSGLSEVFSRCAVATLEEARGHAQAELFSRGETLADTFDLGATLAESGGFVGPLPDGTVIEVRRVEAVDLVRELGLGIFDAEIQGGMDRLLAAYNAKFGAGGLSAA